MIDEVIADYMNRQVRWVKDVIEDKRLSAEDKINLIGMVYQNMSESTDLEEIVWWDIKYGGDNIESIRAGNVKDHFILCSTYGRVIHRDEDGIIVAVTEDDLGDVEYYAIPKGVIITPARYRQ